MHQFAMGQVVRYQPGPGWPPGDAGTYAIVRCLPDDGHGPQYDIQRATDGQQRRVREALLRSDAAADLGQQ